MARSRMSPKGGSYQYASPSLLLTHNINQEHLAVWLQTWREEREQTPPPAPRPKRDAEEDDEEMKAAKKMFHS